MENDKFLQCETKLTFLLLSFVGGYFGAYTYLLRGGVFCNAQTGNVVLFGMALGSMNWGRALYLLIPISAYCGGAAASEFMGKHMTGWKYLRWDTLLVGFELIVAVLLGLLPPEAPDQICQVALNFICSMQYNTFRQAEGMPMATTFCTNHIRMIGVSLVKDKCHGDEAAGAKWRFHVKMVISFIIGCVVSTLLCKVYAYKTISGAAVVLAIVFIRLLYADLVTERHLYSVLPRGH